MMNTIMTTLRLNHTRHTRRLYRASMIMLMLVIGLLAFSTHTHTAHAADTCAPYSPYNCATVKVTPAPAYCLNFNNGNGGGIPDKSGLGTGFTMIDPNSAPLSDQPSGHPNAPSYVDDLISISGGQLKLIATKGLTYGRNGVNNITQTNSLVNGLGVGFTPKGTFEVSARIVNLDLLDTPALNASQQAGIWFAIDEDNYAKLALYKVDDNIGRLQFVVETYNGTTLNIQDFRPDELFVDLNTLTFDLVLEIDATALTANARYRVNDGDWITVSRTSTLTSAFITGKTLPNGEKASFAGILASKRSAPEIEKMTVNFDDFCVTRTGNVEPLTVNDSYNTNEDQPLSVNAADGVLKNDSDPNPGDTLTAAIVAGPTHAASFSLSANGAFNYTPASNYSGSDSFTYRANDGGLSSDLTTVSITVAPVNDAPTAQNAGFNVNEDGTLNVKVANGLATKIADIDTPAHLLTVVLVTPPAKGSIALNPTGSFTYMPMANFNGADSFTYAANDGALNSSHATVNITVNAQPDAPDATDDAYTGYQNSSLVMDAALGVLHNDSNPDGGSFTASVQTAPAHGDLSLSANGSFTYTPDTDYLGEDSFVYTATGGAGSDTATVHLTIALAPSELVINGGFETPDAGNGKLPGDWKGKRLTQDMLRCDDDGSQARSGDCSFEFKGKTGENSSLEQQILESGMIEGDTLVLSAMVKGKGVVGKAGKINVQVTFEDNNKKTYSLIVPRSTYDYRRYSKTFVLPRSATGAKISLTYKGTKGKWWADDVSVKHYATGDAGLAITSRLDGVTGAGQLAVPDAPPGMRGN